VHFIDDSVKSILWRIFRKMDVLIFCLHLGCFKET